MLLPLSCRLLSIPNLLHFLFYLHLLLLHTPSYFLFTHAQIDVSEFFKGSQVRPKLEIVRPENGQILRDTELVIELKISGYSLPSHFHDSSICIAVSTSENDYTKEDCFQQTNELIYHAAGLLPATSYSLRVQFVERAKVIAMSVRSFRVGGITGLIKEREDEAVTIQTALSVALTHQTSGSTDEAYIIYQKVLIEDPNNSAVLNLMGILSHQFGDDNAGLAYFQRAVEANKTSEHIHANLGNLLRRVGRLTEAISHFENALSLNPKSGSALFNMGFIYQTHFKDYDKALQYYRFVLEDEKQEPGINDKTIVYGSKVRECDLLGAISLGNDFQAELSCWIDAVNMFPNDELILNELGNVYVQIGDHTKALEAYSFATSAGSFIARVNRANVLEMQGYYVEAKSTFEECIQIAEVENIYSFHVKIRLAMVVPRILPATDYEIKDIRAKIESMLDKILLEESPVTDSSPPLFYGFSTGFFLTYHGFNDLSIRRKLYKVYLHYCPALTYGYFSNPVTGQLTDPVNIHNLNVGGLPASIDDMQRDAVVSHNKFYEAIADARKAFMQQIESGQESSENILANTAVPLTPTNGITDTSISSNIEAIKSDAKESISTDALSSSTSPDERMPRSGNDHLTVKVPPSKLNVEYKINKLPEAKSKYQHIVISSENRPIRIGFASRFFYSHAIGYLTENLLPILARSGYEVIVFLIDGIPRKESDDVQSKILNAAHSYYLLPNDITAVITSLRNAKLDILIYPEIGIDPIVYFTAFSRIAPVQATWLGHPDTTGMSTIDYYLSDDVEDSGAESTYSEQLLRMRGMGTCFSDRQLHYASSLLQPRTVLLERAKFIEQINIPRAAHVYMIIQPLYTLHPLFDEVIMNILLQDKLGYVVFFDPSWKSSWQELIINRLTGRLSKETNQRLKFVLGTGEFSIQKSIAAAHVILDPYPGSDYLHSMHALSLGVPVITYPGATKRMVGKQCLSLYKRMNYYGLVVNSPTEYVNLALTIAHKPKIRLAHVQKIFSTRSQLYNCSTVLEDWNKFFKQAMNYTSSSYSYTA